MALGTLWLVNIVVAAASLVMLAVLLAVYARNHRQLPSRFSLGLLLFAGLFLVQNLAGIVIYYGMNAQGQGPDVAVPLLVLNAAEALGFGVLLAISWE